MSIDILRAVAILSVIALHWVNARLSSPASAIWQGLTDVFVRVAGHGNYGVTLFFVISGFLITRMTMLREPDLFNLSVRAFYVRRVARIQPLFILIVILGYLVLWAGQGASSHPFQYAFHEDSKATFGWEFLGSLFTFTFNWERILHRDEFMFRGVHWDVLWSLAVEEQFYLGFPLLILWARTPKRLYAALWSIVGFGIVARVVCDIFHAGLLVKVVNSFSCFDTLALGVLCALLGERLPHGHRTSLASIVLGTGAVAIAFYRGGVVWLILGALLFIHGARYLDVFARFGAPLGRIGQLSYGLYLLHASALYIASLLVVDCNVLGGFVAVTAIAYLMAELAYRLYEAPANEWIRMRLLTAPRRSRLEQVL